MLDRIAVGSLQLRGGLELQITDPLKNRPYYRMEDHNLVLGGLYNYLQQLCIYALTSWDGPGKNGHPLTQHGMSSGYVNYYQGFCGYSNNYYTSGDSNFSPSDRGGTFLKNPVEGVFITDSQSAPSAGDTEIEGNIIAAADFRTAVTSGSQYGTFTFTSAYECFRKSYRRWDWTSANGNGTLSRIYLGMLSRALPNFDRSLSKINTSNSVTVFPRFAGKIGNKTFHIVSSVNGVVTLKCVEYDLSDGSLAEETYTIDFPGLGATGIPATNNLYFSVQASPHNNCVYVMPNTVTTTNDWSIAELNLSTGNSTIKNIVSKSGSSTMRIMYSTSSTNFYSQNVGFARVDENGLLYFGHYNGYMSRIDLTQESGEATFLFSAGNAYYREEIFHGGTGIIETLSVGSTPSDFHMIIMCADGYRWELLYNGSYLTTNQLNTATIYSSSLICKGGDLGSFLFEDGGYWLLVRVCSTFVMIDAIESSSPLLQAMTSKLLDEPVTKNDMPMYVGYTLELV